MTKSLLYVFNPFYIGWSERKLKEKGNSDGKKKIVNTMAIFGVPLYYLVR